MHVVITGATGSIGQALIAALENDPAVRSITGIARSVPQRGSGKTFYVAADVAEEQLAPLFEGADVVVHLAWRFQPEKRPDELWSTNVLGSRRVFDAVRQAAVPRLVYVSSFAAYGPREEMALIGEGSATTGIATSLYSRHKAEVERRLDEFEKRYDGIDIVRLRPCATLAESASSGFVRRFADSLPGSSFDDAARQIARYVAQTPLQIVHVHDVAEALRLAITSKARGAFNVTPRPERAREIEGSSSVVARAASIALRLRLSRVDQNLMDLAGRAPMLDGRRAEDELGFVASYTTEQVVAEALSGLRQGVALPVGSPRMDRPSAQNSNSAHVSAEYHLT
ncbi:MAG TPA: NAD-dependent epimerase/dehydratase family protein [Polyangiaceae bacterium]|jgi:nucleoside-diphosphate-sugar epimerase|nr:NAD-dependent epimerase/dehydratase family protein [Polyangiaceae bacterium]